MERREVIRDKASQVKSIGYSVEDKVMEVEFTSGAVYQYSKVSPAFYDEFIHAESLGSFVASRIRGAYEYKRLHVAECLAGVVARDCGANGCSCWCHRLTKTSRETENHEKEKPAKKQKKLKAGI